MKNRPHKNSIWHTRIDNLRTYQTVRVSEDDDSKVTISFFSGSGYAGYGFSISRNDARLLAKRINQCLNATSKR